MTLKSATKDSRGFVKSINERKRIRTRRNDSQLPDHIYFNTSGSIIPTMNDDYEEDLPPVTDNTLSNGRLPLKNHGHLSQQVIKNQRKRPDTVFENRSDEAIYFNDKVTTQKKQQYFHQRGKSTPQTNVRLTLNQKLAKRSTKIN